MAAGVSLLLLALLAPADLRPARGWRVEVWADGISDARSLAHGNKGTIFVGTRRDGRIWAIRNGRKHLLARDLRMPNGIAFRNGALFVVENHRILRWDRIEDRLDEVPPPVVVRADLPSDRHHGWRYAAFGPDGLLYLSIGAPCNVCDRGDPFASISRTRPEGGAIEVFARGIRNSVGFDWRPGTRELWFTDNGRDHLGDEFPPDEINRADRAGLHFGFPYFHGPGAPDPAFGTGRDSAGCVPPVKNLGAHVAALGIRFLSRDEFLVAEHGSWNRSSRVGYRVMRGRIRGRRVVSYEPFLTGFLAPDGSIRGRPVDVLPLADGSVLVSDDHAGRIYRMTRR